jgi:ATP-dependent helicase Lhr and Lhr-like helicase
VLLSQKAPLPQWKLFNVAAFDLLRSEIKTYIWEQGWPSLRPIQEAAITQVSTTNDNLILAAPTASGKTEAAFLPAINEVSDWQSGVKILYVSPLIALINDQFKRVTDLCEYLNVPVTSWHGEASQAQKKHLIKQPQGIILITPESIEAMLVRRPAEARRLFSGIEYIIIDELHSFLDSVRGVHLQSLLQRIRALTIQPPRHIGLSATLSRDSYALAKTFFGVNQTTTVLLDSSRNELTVTLQHEQNDKPLLPAAIIDDIYERSQSERMLVFPNARGKVEDIAVRLQKRAKRDNSSVRYFAHHASVDKELRLEAEHFAKSSQGELFTICCTSTLELGIDIGAVDSICQVEAAPSVASLAQRLGRSGRLKHHSKLHLYSTNGWSLAQSVASTELFRQGKLELITPIAKPFDVLFQQILSHLLERNSLKRDGLTALLNGMPYWQQITLDEINELLDHMISIGFIEVVDGEFIAGLAAERIIESRGFYAHFEDKQEFRVLHNAQHIGDMPHLPTVEPGVNVFLAARIWKITSIDDETKKIFVIPAHDGKPPVYGGEGGEVSHLVRQTMRSVLLDSLEGTLPSYTEQTSLVALREIAQSAGVEEGSKQSLQARQLPANKETLATFAGTRINKTILLYLTMQPDEEKVELDDHASTITGRELSRRVAQICHAPVTVESVKAWLMDSPAQLTALTSSNKYARFLPQSLQIQSVIHNNLDIPSTNEFLGKFQSATRPQE